LNRNACTFKKPKDLLAFINNMKNHATIGAHPVRIKNMFLFNEDQAKRQFFYRTIMINWLYTPGFTYGELAEKAKPLWDTYINYESVPGYGHKDPSVPPSMWQSQMAVAMQHLMNPEMKNVQVQFIVETQLLLPPYLSGRNKMHLLYKICRAENPEALYSDFRYIVAPEARSFEQVQSDALVDMKAYVAQTNDINRQHKELKGATRLWKASEQGHAEAVREILQHPNVDPNKTRSETQATPLYIASYHGHRDVVKALLGHPKIQVNLGTIDKHASPLFAAVQQGHEEVVEALLEVTAVDVNQPTTEGITPLFMACSHGHEHISKILLSMDSINVERKLQDGTTALILAENQGHLKIMEMIQGNLFRRTHLKTVASTGLAGQVENLNAQIAAQGVVNEALQEELGSLKRSTERNGNAQDARAAAQDARVAAQDAKIATLEARVAKLVARLEVSSNGNIVKGAGGV
jgi:ankyrin repeat protein